MPSLHPSGTTESEVESGPVMETMGLLRQLFSLNVLNLHFPEDTPCPSS